MFKQVEKMFCVCSTVTKYEVALFFRFHSAAKMRNANRTGENMKEEKKTPRKMC